MSNFKKFFSPTKLARKLIKQIALVALASLVIAFGLAYAIFWPRLRNDAHDQAATASRYIMLSINEAVQTLDGYASYMTSSPALSEALRAYDGDTTYNNYGEVNSILFSLKSISSNMRAVVLYGRDGSCFQAGNLGPQDVELLQSSWMADIMSNASVHNWSSLYQSDPESPEQTLLRVSMCSIAGQEYLLSIFYDASTLIGRITTLAENTYTGYLLTDRHDGVTGLPFYTVGNTGNAAEIAADYDSREPWSTRDNKGHYFLITIPANGWQLVGFIDRATFNSSLTPFIWLLFLICLSLGILMVLAFVPAVNRLLAPLGELGETMKNVSENGQDFYSQVQTDDEIGELSDIFNDMLDELRIKNEQSIDQREREQHLTYNLMVSQINSHFFYNTLSVINSLARQGRNEDVIRANNALTTIFQDCLRPQSISVGDTVEQEKSIVECYWVIEALDPANEAVLSWDIPDELMEKRIPKNIIQPLVENALFHGLDNAETGKKSGWIKVSMGLEGGEIVLEVSNNGAPIEPEILKRLENGEELPYGGSHIGLANIRRRLEMLYGDDARLTITSGSVTAVSIRMPDAP